MVFSDARVVYLSSQSLVLLILQQIYKAHTKCTEKSCDSRTIVLNGKHCIYGVLLRPHFFPLFLFFQVRDLVHERSKTTNLQWLAKHYHKSTCHTIFDSSSSGKSSSKCTYQKFSFSKEAQAKASLESLDEHLIDFDHRRERWKVPSFRLPLSLPLLKISIFQC